MKRSWAQIAVVVAALLSPCVRAEAEGERVLLVVEVSPDDHAAAQRLLALSEQPSQLVRMPEAREPTQSLALARAAGAERVVVFDQAVRRVVVLRTSDGQQWTRGTEQDDGTPFVAAFLAVELLALSEGRAAPAPVAPPVVAVRHVRLGLRAGLELLASAPYAGSPRPALGLFVAFRPPRAALWWWLELAAAPHAEKQHRLPERDLTLTRSDLGLRGGPLLQEGRLALLGYAEVGLLLERARAAEGADLRRSSLVLGLGIEPAVQLTSFLALYGSCLLRVASQSASFRVDGTTALREPRASLQLGAGLWLTVPD